MGDGIQSHSAAECPHFDPMDPRHAANPYQTYRMLRRDAPIFYHPQLDVWVVSRYADVIAALEQPAIFSSSGSLTAAGQFPPSVRAVLSGGVGMGQLITESDGAKHRRLRKAFKQGFTRQRVARMEPHIRAIADELIDQFVADNATELVSRFALPLLGFIICDLFGLPRSDLAKLKQWNHDLVALLSVDVPEESQVSYAHSVLAYEQYVRDRFHDRQRIRSDDLITLVLPEGLGGTARLSLGEAIYNVMDSIAGAYETTEKMITNAVVSLFEHPEQYNRIGADPALLDRAVEELLRFASPVQGIFRVTMCPIELGGVSLPADARIFLLYASANHDEQRFTNADTFDIDRPFVRHHTTFGRGAHVCIGAALARLTIRVALELLQKRLPNLRAAAGVEPRRVHHVWLSGYETLPVEWDSN